jgi:light-regulated signal transduction histidine kinase (bacteriophytochrome)
LLSLYKSDSISVNDLDIYLKRIQDQVGATATMLDSMLMWVNSQLAHFKPNVASHNLNSLVQKTLNLYQVDVENESVSFTVNINNNTTIETDEKIYTLIIRNIIESFTRWASKEHIHLSITKNDNGLCFGSKDVEMQQITEDDIFSDIEAFPGTITAKNRNVSLKITKRFCELLNCKLIIANDFDKTNGTEIKLVHDL